MRWQDVVAALGTQHATEAAAALIGQMTLTPAQAQDVSAPLGLSAPTRSTARQAVTYKGSLPTAVPTDAAHLPLR